MVKDQNISIQDIWDDTWIMPKSRLEDELTSPFEYDTIDEQEERETSNE
jgi:hypothetical protein